jgi:antitoxin HicB
MTASYTVVLLAEQNGRYSAFVPALPGALSWGDTVEEALANIAEAIEGLLEAMQEDRETIPVEHPHTVVTTVTVRVPEPASAVA